jgi:hypothetical protein
MMGSLHLKSPLSWIGAAIVKRNRTKERICIERISSLLCFVCFSFQRGRVAGLSHSKRCYLETNSSLASMVSLTQRSLRSEFHENQNDPKTHSNYDSLGYVVKCVFKGSGRSLTYGAYSLELLSTKDFWFLCIVIMVTVAMMDRTLLESITSFLILFLFRVSYSLPWMWSQHTVGNKGDQAPLSLE